MLNRCFSYQQPLQILAILHLLLIKSSPRHKRANILIRQGSGKKNNPCCEGASPPPFLRLLLPPEGGDKRSRRTYKCEDKEQLVKMVDDKHNAPCGWRHKVKLPAHWVALLVFATNVTHVALTFIIQTFLVWFYLYIVPVCSGCGLQGHHYKSFSDCCQNAKVHERIMSTNSM